MKFPILLLLLLSSELLNCDEKANEGDIVVSAERPIVNIVRIGSHPIILHTERQGIRFGESERLFPYAKGGQFLLEFLATSKSTQDIVVYQHEKAIIRQEDEFLQKLAETAKKRKVKVIVFSTETGRLDPEFDQALHSFIAK